MEDSLGLILLVIAGVLLFYTYCIGRLFEKAGKPLWAAFIPIYNTIVLLDIIGWSRWWLLLYFAVSLIPIFGTIASLIISIMLAVELAKVFGKSAGYGVALAIFGFIMLPVLAFDDAVYVGPARA